MKILGRIAVATGLLAVVAAPVDAQRYRFDMGVNGGYSWYSAMLGSDETGLGDSAPGEDVRFESGPLLGAQLTFWLSDRIGLRANATYADRPVVADEAELVPFVNLWSGTGDLMFRFATPNDEWMGSEFLPYLALGVGGKWHNPATDAFICSDPEEGKLWSCAPFSVGTGANQTIWALGEQKVIAGLVGLGADWRFSPRFALRLEANDRIYKPQVYVADAPVAGNVNLPNGDQVESKIVHEIGGQVGLHLLMGLRQAETVAVAPAPAPPPTPAPQPAPAPAPPATRDITVCVIDPTTATGIRQQQAVFMIETGDTLAVVSGNRVPLNTAVGTVPVARDADWYVRGAPLTVNLGNQRWEFVTYGGAMMVRPDELAYLGTINGMPVYANAAEVQDIREEIAEARTAHNGDFAMVLENNQDLREDLDDVRILYVPLQPAGCVFQPVQRQEEVRKSGGN